MENVEIAVGGHRAAAVAVVAVGKLEEHNWDDNFEQTMELEVGQADAAFAHMENSAEDVEAPVADPIVVEDTIVQAARLADLCREQDSAVHSRHLQQHVARYRHPHVRDIEESGDSHLDHPDSYHLYFFLFHLRAVPADTVGMQPGGEAVEEDSCIGQRP